MDALGAFLKTALYRVIFVRSYCWYPCGVGVFLCSYSNEILAEQIELNLDNLQID